MPQLPPITSGDVLMFLCILVGIMLVVVLYHILFIVVNLRKISKRVEGVTQQVEMVVMKPLSMIEQVMQWVLDRTSGGKKNKNKSESFDRRKVS